MTTDRLEAAVAALLGASLAERERVTRGYTHVERWRIRTTAGDTAFAKVAVDETSARWLRDEAQMYQALGNAPYLASFRGLDDAERPVLLVADLGAAHWPPPWRDGDVAAVLEALGEVARTPAPPWLAPIRDSNVVRGWEAVGDDPAPVLGIGWFDSDWLDDALPTLRGAAAACPLDGTALLHMDVRSDNICIRADGAAVLVDWNLAAIGPPRLDVAFWLPSLSAERGPPPEAILPDAGPEAAVVAGFFAARVGLPIISVAPLVRVVQLQQLRVALPWACRALGIRLP